MNIKYFLAIIGVFLIAGVFGLFIVKNFNNQTTQPAKVSYNNNTEDMKKPTKRTNKVTATPTPTLEPTISEQKEYTAVMHTEKGDITISLNTKETPITVNNFITLSKKGFYNNTIFHRVIKGFMIQGGDPTGTGSGGPGYTFADEPFSGEYTRGTLAMANAGPNTNGSQFFIMQEDNALPKNYVIFGKVTSGIEVVDTIANAPVQQSSSGEQSSPVKPVKITSIDIEK